MKGARRNGVLGAFGAGAAFGGILLKKFLITKGCSGLRDAVVPRQALLNKGCRGTKANLMPDRGAFGAAVYMRAPPYL